MFHTVLDAKDTASLNTTVTLDKYVALLLEGCNSAPPLYMRAMFPLVEKLLVRLLLVIQHLRQQPKESSAVCAVSIPICGQPVASVVSTTL
jgi:hypothetical protein